MIIICLDSLVIMNVSISRFTNNFGVLGVLDHLHGTDAMFRASKQYQRHFLLLGLIPVKTQIPDDPVKGKSPVRQTKAEESN